MRRDATIGELAPPRPTARAEEAASPRKAARVAGAGRASSVRTLLGLAAPAPASRTMLAYDVSLAWAALLLLAIGLVMVYSASIAMAESSAQTAHRSWYFLARHAVFVAIGLAAAVCAFQVPV